MAALAGAADNAAAAITANAVLVKQFMPVASFDEARAIP
jgi:hypothetical protein